MLIPSTLFCSPAEVRYRGMAVNESCFVVRDQSKREKCICHARESTGKRESIKVLKHDQRRTFFPPAGNQCFYPHPAYQNVRLTKVHRYHSLQTIPYTMKDSYLNNIKMSDSIGQSKPGK